MELQLFVGEDMLKRRQLVLRNKDNTHLRDSGFDIIRDFFRRPLKMFNRIVFLCFLIKADQNPCKQIAWKCGNFQLCSRIDGYGTVNQLGIFQDILGVLFDHLPKRRQLYAFAVSHKKLPPQFFFQT